MENNFKILVVGTDPRSCAGGIAAALPGYFYALKLTGLKFDFVSSHHASVWGGKWRFWFVAFYRIISFRWSCALNGQRMILYAHVGGGAASFFRLGSLSVLARLLGISVVMQLHSAEVNNYLISGIGRLFFYVTTSASSVLCVLTPWWQLRLRAAGICKPIYVVPNPLDDKLEQIACTHGNRVKTKDDLIILCMTRIVEGKGVDLLIESVPLLPENVRVVIAGDGTQLIFLKKRVRELNIEHRVDFRGWVDGAIKKNLLGEADIFCLPSSYDSFGMGFIEAMAHGLPVVALDWGPIKDVVPHGHCGLLIASPEPVLLADALCCLAKDDVLRSTLGNNGRHWVIAQFGARHVGHAIRSVMEHVCH